MSLTTLVLELCLVAAGTIGLRRRRDWLFVFALAAGAIGAAISVAWYIAGRTIWWLAVWDLLLAPATLVVAIAAVRPTLLLHLPPRARRFAEFDRALYSALVELGRVLGDGPAQQDRATLDSWIAHAQARGQEVLRRLERIKAPDPDTADLLAAYRELTLQTVDAINSGVTSDESRRLTAIGDKLATRYEDLRTRDRR